jgi:hypothetical protein
MSDEQQTAPAAQHEAPQDVLLRIAQAIAGDMADLRKSVLEGFAAAERKAAARHETTSARLNEIVGGLGDLAGHAEKMNELMEGLRADVRGESPGPDGGPSEQEILEKLAEVAERLDTLPKDVSGAVITDLAGLAPAQVPADEAAAARPI